MIAEKMYKYYITNLQEHVTNKVPTIFNYIEYKPNKKIQENIYLYGIKYGMLYGKVRISVVLPTKLIQLSYLDDEILRETKLEFYFKITQSNLKLVKEGNYMSIVPRDAIMENATVISKEEFENTVGYLKPVIKTRESVFSLKHKTRDILTQLQERVKFDIITDKINEVVILIEEDLSSYVTIRFSPDDFTNDTTILLRVYSNFRLSYIDKYRKILRECDRSVLQVRKNQETRS